MAWKSIKPAYEQLKDQYDLVLTNTFALKNGYEDFREDFEIICGESSAGKFQIYHNGCSYIFDVDKADGTHTHGHLADIDGLIEDIREFMQGRCKY
jgi:hypothetical protein